MVNVRNSLDEDTKDIYIIFCYWNPSVKTLRVAELNAALCLFTSEEHVKEKSIFPEWAPNPQTVALTSIRYASVQNKQNIKGG